MIAHSDDKTNFPHELILTNRQDANLRKVFASQTSTDIKFSKTQLSKMIQSGGFLGRPFRSITKNGLPLIKNVIKPLDKNLLIQQHQRQHQRHQRQMQEYIKEFWDLATIQL